MKPVPSTPAVSPSAFKVTHLIQPRFRDTDAMGHINNAVYVTYLEVGRQVYWAELDRETDYRNVPFILAHVRCDFRSEALVKETLEIGLRCEWIGGKSFAFRYQIRERESLRLVVEAETIQVCYDYARKQSIPMPDELRSKLETFEGWNLTRKETR